MCVCGEEYKPSGRQKKKFQKPDEKSILSLSVCSLSASVLLPNGWSLKCASYMRLGNSISGEPGRDAGSDQRQEKFITRHKSSPSSSSSPCPSSELIPFKYTTTPRRTDRHQVVWVSSTSPNRCWLGGQQTVYQVAINFPRFRTRRHTRTGNTL